LSRRWPSGAKIFRAGSAFFARYANDQGLPPPEISIEAMAALQAYEWPGNVRQLRNVVERTVILAPRLGRIESICCPPKSNGRLAGDSGMSSLMGVPARGAREFEREYLRVQIRRFPVIFQDGGFIGMERSALHRKLKLLGMGDKRDDEDEE
jgi:two-component system nitrogen regulation response regulator NtrX